jgi:hypothetical protein
MIYDAPNPPSGSRKFVAWCRRVLGAIDANRILSGRGYNVVRTSRGVILEIDPGGGKGASVLPYYVVEHHEEYTLCSPFDGVQPSGEATVIIAKPWELRYSVSSEVLDNIQFNYASYSLTGQSRVATWTAGTETQFIVPRYRFGSIIAAFKCGKTGVEDATHLELSARAWSAP